MGLKTYRAKRDFVRTPEPSGAEGPASGPLPIFVIQRHEASHLHWDLRLEEDGVLRSWAVPKEPPVEAGTRRLAVQVEDHPLAYASFEGRIPEGEYGAGKVEIWDQGTYVPLERTGDKRVFEVRGRRLKGPYGLVRLKGKDGQDRNWLFFKLKEKD